MDNQNSDKVPSRLELYKKKYPRKKRILKKKYRNFLFIFFLLLFIGGLSFSIIKIFLWSDDNSKTKKIEEEVINNVKIEEVSPSIDDENTSLINEPTNETDIYWKYKDVPLISVDIKKLKQDNNDTVGWIQVPGTNINYPVVQSNNNDYYLNHDYLKRVNGGGWVFLDYRNNLDELAKNNIIYGHRRVNQSMFGTLKNVLTNNWLSNTDNHIIKISSLNYNYLFQVFSVYSIPKENYYIQTVFNSDEAYQEFLNTIVSRSIYNFNTEVNINTRILTLSTCHNDNGRLVVHAKLIKINAKN